ncbi:EamA family transporter [Rheinheimera sp.]|uniref:EamA family transporter n=1 Tax=Rheinheimera sp. TaxID=1869214 RepID=UPI00307F897D
MWLSRIYYPALAISSAALMASIGPIARLSQVDAASLTFYRLAFGAVAIGLFLLFSRQLQLVRSSPHWTVVLNGVLLASFILCFLQAIQTLSLTVAIMLVYLAPAFAALIAHFWFKERLTPFSLAMILLAFFGFVLLQDLSADQSGLYSAGLWYALGSLLTYCAFLLVNKKVPVSEHRLNSTFYQLLVGACCALPFMLQQDAPSAAQWPWLIAAGLFPGALALWCAVQALSHLPARVYGTLAYTEPVVVVLCAWWFFAEPLSLRQSMGVSLIILAGIAQTAGTKPAQPNDRAVPQA